MPVTKTVLISDIYLSEILEKRAIAPSDEHQKCYLEKLNDIPLPVVKTERGYELKAGVKRFLSAKTANVSELRVAVYEHDEQIFNNMTDRKFYELQTPDL